MCLKKICPIEQLFPVCVKFDGLKLERHNSILQFKNLLVQIVNALNDISQWDSVSSSRKSNILVSVICNCDFILLILSLFNTLSITYPTSNVLQWNDKDVFTASKYIRDVFSTLEKQRNNCEEVFKSLFQ